MVFLSRSCMLLAFSSIMWALYLHSDNGMNSSHFVDSKKSSNLRWNCGDTRPVLMDRIRYTDLACIGEGPRYVPSLLLISHLPILCPFCNAFSSTYTGHPKGCNVSKPGGWLEFENVDSGTVPSFDLGVRFIISLANRTAYGHYCGAAASFHWCIAWVIITLA